MAKKQISQKETDTRRDPDPVPCDMVLDKLKREKKNNFLYTFSFFKKNHFFSFEEESFTLVAPFNIPRLTSSKHRARERG